MRLFAAVQVPEVACTDLSDRLARVRDDLDDLPPLRWVDPVGWHLTLAFYGEVTSPPPLTAGLSRVAQHSPPGTAMLSDAGTFGGSRAASARSARLVWVGMVTEPQTLSRLAACCAAALPGHPCDGLFSGRTSRSPGRERPSMRPPWWRPCVTTVGRAGASAIWCFYARCRPGRGAGHATSRCSVSSWANKPSRRVRTGIG